MPSQTMSSQYSTTGTSDSIASSYRPPVHTRPSLPPSNLSNTHVPDALIHHPTIMKLQQQNFHRLLSSAESSTSSSASMIKQHSTIPPRSDREDDQGTYISSSATTTTNEGIQSSSDNQRATLHQRKQALMKAIQNIDRQMEKLDMQ